MSVLLLLLHRFQGQIWIFGPSQQVICLSQFQPQAISLAHPLIFESLTGPGAGSPIGQTGQLTNPAFSSCLCLANLRLKTYSAVPDFLYRCMGSELRSDGTIISACRVTFSCSKQTDISSCLPPGYTEAGWHAVNNVGISPGQWLYFPLLLCVSKCAVAQTPFWRDEKQRQEET